MSSSLKVTVVPATSRKRIWLHTMEIQQRYYPDVLRKPQPFPIDDFYEYVMIEDFGIDVGPSDDLVHDEGLTRPSNKNERPECLLRRDVWELLHQGNGRARFTAAHECGHGIMHTPYLKAHLARGTQPEMRRREEIPRYLDPEWQAFEFAGSLLMPTSAVVAFVNRYGADVEGMTKAFMVSYSAAETRLGILHRVGILPKAA